MTAWIVAGPCTSHRARPGEPALRVRTLGHSRVQSVVSTVVVLAGLAAGAAASVALTATGLW